MLNLLKYKQFEGFARSEREQEVHNKTKNIPNEIKINARKRDAKTLKSSKLEPQREPKSVRNN